MADSGSDPLSGPPTDSHTDPLSGISLIYFWAHRYDGSKAHSCYICPTEYVDIIGDQADEIGFGEASGKHSDCRSDHEIIDYGDEPDRFKSLFATCLTDRFYLQHIQDSVECILYKRTKDESYKHDMMARCADNSILLDNLFHMLNDMINKYIADHNLVIENLDSIDDEIDLHIDDAFDDDSTCHYDNFHDFIYNVAKQSLLGALNLDTLSDEAGKLIQRMTDEFNAKHGPDNTYDRVKKTHASLIACSIKITQVITLPNGDTITVDK